MTRTLVKSLRNELIEQCQCCFIVGHRDMPSITTVGATEYDIVWYGHQW